MDDNSITASVRLTRIVPLHDAAVEHRCCHEKCAVLSAFDSLMLPEGIQSKGHIMSFPSNCIPRRHLFLIIWRLVIGLCPVKDIGATSSLLSTTCASAAPCREASLEKQGAVHVKVGRA